MMTKKHFKAIAEAIKFARHRSSPEAWVTLTEAAENMAVFFKQENPAFDKQKFLDATYY